MNIEQMQCRQIKALCSLLGYSRQAYYQQRRATELVALQRELIVQQVLLIRERQKNVGARKLLLMLQSFLGEHKIAIGRDALFALLSGHNLLIRRRKRKIPRTTFSDHWLRKYPNLIEHLCVDRPNQLWVSDITYITTTDGFGYLSLVTDAYSRKIVGYYLSKDLSADGCVQALKMAIKTLPKGSDLIHHSDRGCQYCSTEYVEQLMEHGISISMTQNGDPRDNAIAERVNGIIKIEFIESRNYSFGETIKQIDKTIYIYNYERLHSSIDMLTPQQAHTQSGTLKRHWKNYYKTKQKEVAMT